VQVVDNVEPRSAEAIVLENCAEVAPFEPCALNMGGEDSKELLIGAPTAIDIISTTCGTEQR
jgi:hypothetical protein